MSNKKRRLTAMLLTLCLGFTSFSNTNFIKINPLNYKVSAKTIVEQLVKPYEMADDIKGKDGYDTLNQILNRPSRCKLKGFETVRDVWKTKEGWDHTAAFRIPNRKKLKERIYFDSAVALVKMYGDIAKDINLNEVKSVNEILTQIESLIEKLSKERQKLDSKTDLTEANKLEEKCQKLNQIKKSITDEISQDKDKDLYNFRSGGKTPPGYSELSMLGLIDQHPQDMDINFNKVEVISEPDSIQAFSEYMVFLESEKGIKPYKILNNNPALNVLNSWFGETAVTEYSHKRMSQKGKNLLRSLVDGPLMFVTLPLAGATVIALQLGLIGFSMSKSGDVLKGMKTGLANLGDKFKQRFFYNRKKIGNDPNKIVLLQQILEESVVGQEAPISDIVEYIQGQVNLKRLKKHEPGLINFAGSSGTGKTLIARLMFQFLYGRQMADWQFISASQIDEKSSVIANKQLFKVGSELHRQLKLNNDIILCFDEVDKKGNELLEALRNATDDKFLEFFNPDGSVDKVSIEKTLIICTTNEIPECFFKKGKLSAKLVKDGICKTEDQALEYISKLSTEESKKLLSTVYAQDRTYVKRSKSLANRFRTICFNEHTEKTLSEIFKKEMILLLSLEFQKTKTDVYPVKGIYEKVGKEAFAMQKGARAVGDYINSLSSAFSNFVLENGKENVYGSKITIDFNSEGKFVFDFYDE